MFKTDTVIHSIKNDTVCSIFLLFHIFSNDIF